MCSLALFPPPLPPGQTTLCESNNELLSGANNSEARQDSSPLSLHFPRESLKLHSRTESSSKAAFLDHSETLWMRSAAAWRDGGFTGLLNEITTSHAEVPKWLSVTSGCILALLRWVSSFHGSLYPHVTLSSEDMIAEFSQVLNWSDCVVRAFAWHPHTDKFAVTLLDDSIKIYNPKSAISPTLKHRLQKNVAAVQWKPLCASALAVACQNCLLVWNVDPCSLSTRPSSGCAQVLSHPGHSPVTSIAWSPSGSLLVSASPLDTSMMVRGSCFSFNPRSDCAASCFHSCSFDMDACFRFGMSLQRAAYLCNASEEAASPSCPGPQTAATSWHPHRLPCSGSQNDKDYKPSLSYTG